MEGFDWKVVYQSSLNQSRSLVWVDLLLATEKRERYYGARRENNLDLFLKKTRTASQKRVALGTAP